MMSALTGTILVIALAVCFDANVVHGRKNKDTSAPSFIQKSVGTVDKFTSEYTIVTSTSNYQTHYKRFPSMERTTLGDNPNFVIGSSTIQSGNVFRPASVNLVQVLENYAGGVQPETTPDLNSAFTFNGECVATCGKGFSHVEAQTCIYNLCLRGSQNCIFLYSGTAFNFNRAPSLSAKDGTFGNEVIKNDFFADGTTNNPLPPSFPGVVIGGVNDFVGITGNFELITVAGDLPYDPVLKNGRDVVDELGKAGDIQPETFAPTATPTESDNAPVSPSMQPTSRPTFDGTQAPTQLNLEPAIVQKLFVKSNIRLPKAPKATQARNKHSEDESNE